MRSHNDPPFVPFRKNLAVPGKPGMGIEKEYQTYCEAQGFGPDLRKKYRS